MARSIFKREKLLADMRALNEPLLQPIIDQIEVKQLGYTNTKTKVQVEQLYIDLKFQKENQLRP